MTRARHRQLSLDVPDEWQDRTITAFTAPPSNVTNGFRPNVVITEEALPFGDTLDSFATKQIMRLAGQIADFELDRTESVDVRGHRGVALRFWCKGEDGPVEQRQLLVEAEGRVYAVTISAARADAIGHLGTTFERMLGSIDLWSPKASTYVEPPSPWSSNLR